MHADDSGHSAKRERIASALRRVNAALAALLAIFFLVHACLGAFAQIAPMENEAPALVWLFAALILVHVALCAATSRYMLADEIRPPSKAKKRHLALKWASGAILLACALLHAFAVPGAHIALMLVLLGVIAWHTYVGVKSLIRDLRLPRTLKLPIRITCIAAAIVIAAIAIAGALA